MRLWSLHPRYLDTKGLTALWREGLLALAVLRGKTKGYKNHPQLDRFKACENPVGVLSYYLLVVWNEAHQRGHHFDIAKLPEALFQQYCPVTAGQVAYEHCHLLTKLQNRGDKVRVGMLIDAQLSDEIELHPLFTEVSGEVEPWERINK